jgi:DNA primase
MSDRFLDFNKISYSIRFEDFLNWLNLPYKEKKGELRGETDKFSFIVNVSKNLFFSPDDDTIKGSVINFFSELRNINLRDAAVELKKEFLSQSEPVEKKIPDLELVYAKELLVYGISEEIAKSYEIGIVKQRSIMKGRITFKVYDEAGNLAGYVGYSSRKDDWLFPKGFKRPLYNAFNLNHGDEVILTTSLFDTVRLIDIGFPNTVCLIANSMTESQYLELIKFKSVIIIHPDPLNIVQRVVQNLFVKVLSINKPLKEHSAEEIGSLLCL